MCFEEGRRNRWIVLSLPNEDTVGGGRQTSGFARPRLTLSSRLVSGGEEDLSRARADCQVCVCHMIRSLHSQRFTPRDDPCDLSAFGRDGACHWPLPLPLPPSLLPTMRRGNSRRRMSAHGPHTIGSASSHTGDSSRDSLDTPRGLGGFSDVDR